jgi:hypothetical protein
MSAEPPHQRSGPHTPFDRPLALRLEKPSRASGVPPKTAPGNGPWRTCHAAGEPTTGLARDSLDASDQRGQARLSAEAVRPPPGPRVGVLR